jgi:hypothetical protein
MTGAESLELLDHVKWAAAVAIVAIVAVCLLRNELRAFVSGLRNRRVKFAGTDLAPEQIAQPPPRPEAGAAQMGRDDPAKALSAFEANDDPYYRSQIETLTQQVDALHFNSPAERDRWMLREGAGLLIQLEFERTYRVIWESQLHLVSTANHAPVTRAETQAFHQRIVDGNPRLQGGDTFDRWLGYLTNLGLVQAQGTNLVTTTKGKLFLQYLIRSGLDPLGLAQNRGL